MNEYGVNWPVLAVILAGIAGFFAGRWTGYREGARDVFEHTVSELVTRLEQALLTD